jgi:hypothetical protein
MKNHHQLSLAIALYTLIPTVTEGSAEHSVASMLRSVTIQTGAGLSNKGGKYSFKIDLDGEGALVQIEATYKGGTKQVPKSEIPPINKADLGQVQVTSWRHVVSYDDPLDSVIVVIPFQQEFRKDPESDADSDKIRVSNVIRFLFADGELVRWEMAVSSGEKSNAWTLTCKDKGEAVEEAGKEAGLVNPYWSHNPVNYSTPWSKEP